MDIILLDRIYTDIQKCAEVLNTGDSKSAGGLCHTIVAAYSQYINNITSGLSQHSYLRCVDYLEDVELLKYKLECLAAKMSNTTLNTNVEKLFRKMRDEVNNNSCLPENDIAEIHKKIDETESFIKAKTGGVTEDYTWFVTTVTVK